MPSAIHVITSSSDHYNFCTNQTLNENTLADFLHEKIDDEFAYISEVYCTVVTAGDREIEVSTKITYRKAGLFQAKLENLE